MPSKKPAFTVRWNGDYADRLDLLQSRLSTKYATPNKQATLEAAIDLALESYAPPDQDGGDLQILKVRESADGECWVRVRVGDGRPTWLSPEQVRILGSTCHPKVAP